MKWCASARPFIQVGADDKSDSWLAQSNTAVKSRDSLWPIVDLPSIQLDSPRWLELTTDGTPRAEVPRLLRDIEKRGAFGDAWEQLCGGPILHQGTIYQSTYAVLPCVVSMAANLGASTLARFWIDIGFIVANIDEKNPQPPIPTDLEPGLRAALTAAEPLAIQSFCAANLEEEDASYLALACLALSRHPVRASIWEFFASPQPGKGFVDQFFFRAECPRCDAELEWMHVADGILEYTRGRDDPSRPDLNQPEPEAPELPDLLPWRRPTHPWNPIAEALMKPMAEIRTLDNRTSLPPDLVRRFAEHIRVAAAIAEAGVPQHASSRAAFCLLGTMVALKGAFDWASRLLRLAGFMCCPECGKLSPFSDCLPTLQR